MKPISPALQWTICAVAALGFLFDIYEVLIGPLILQPALQDLGGFRPGTPEYRDWAGYLFWFPPLVGGFCGFWGGYLTDLFGRRRVLTFSILVYTVASLAAGFATSLPQLLLFRIIAFSGVCVEFVAAVAWLAEIFTEPKRREAVIGYTQAFSSLGGLVVSVAFYLANRYGADLPAIHGAHTAWRYTLIFGLVPALPLAIVRPFLPESPEWERQKAEGTLRRPHVSELFAGKLRRTTLVTFLLFSCGYGLAFGTIQQSPQITPGLPEVALLAGAERGQAVASVQFAQELGGLLGRLLMAALGVYIVSRQKLLRMFLIPGLVVVPFVFAYASTHSLSVFRIGIFCSAIFTVALLNFLGNYLPRVYPVYLRGTGEGFSANVGGRMVGTFASYVVTHLAVAMPGDLPQTKLTYASAAVGVGIYSLALVLSFLLPEPRDS